MSAPSPPELPPAVSLLFFGFKVYPMILLTVSPDISVCGTLVLQYSTAPAFLNMVTISLSYTFSFPVPFLPSKVPIQPTYPMLVSTSFTWN
jgi:hypothetical protein